MKIKHNKKRNTAFVYEALIKEATEAIVKNDLEKKQKIVKIIKNYFAPFSELKRDLDCYRSLYETRGLDSETSEKIIKEAKLSKMLIDPANLFKQQTSLINDINKDLSPDIFNNFVPNYKTLATIFQMFNGSNPKQQIMLESQLTDFMSTAEEEVEEMVPIDNIVYNSFVKKFNEKYGDSLLKEQKELLMHYITSFVDNSLELKIFLNEEIGRLKVKLQEAKTTDEIKSDASMINKTDSVISKLDNYSKEIVSESLLLTVLKTQKLVKEIYSDVSSS
tara:strand:- start:1017 stop:1847 length:831 start_codon:yes stop_codon:yes gene_type:complete